MIQEVALDISLVGILLTMALALYRAGRGPTVYDRLVAVNQFGTATVLLIAVYGFLTHRPDFLDLALIYVLMSFIGILAVLKFKLTRDLGSAAEERP